MAVTAPRRATASTPAEQVTRHIRAMQIADGTVRIPLACPHCLSANLDTDERQLRCISCGRWTTEARVHTIRCQRIARFLRTGDL